MTFSFRKLHRYDISLKIEGVLVVRHRQPTYLQCLKFIPENSNCSLCGDSVIKEIGLPNYARLNENPY